MADWKCMTTRDDQNEALRPGAKDTSITTKEEFWRETNTRNEITLHPVDFVKFSSACRALRNLNLKKSGINLNFYFAAVRSLTGFRLKYFKNGEGKKTFSVSAIRNIIKFPFDLKIDVIFKGYLDVYDIPVVSDSLRSLGSFSTISVIVKEWSIHARAYSTVHCWRELIAFIKTLNPENFSYNGILEETVLRELISINFDELTISRVFPREMFSLVRQKIVICHQASIAFFKQVVQDMAMGRIYQMATWTFYENNHLFENVDLIEECYGDFMEVEHDHEGPLPLDRPLFCCHENGNPFMLNVDDKVFHFFHYSDYELGLGRISADDNDFDVPAPLKPFL